MSLVPCANFLIHPDLSHWSQLLQKSPPSPKHRDPTSSEKTVLAIQSSGFLLKSLNMGLWRLIFHKFSLDKLA